MKLEALSFVRYLSPCVFIAVRSKQDISCGVNSYYACSPYEKIREDEKKLRIRGDRCERLAHEIYWLPFPFATINGRDERETERYGHL